MQVLARALEVFGLQPVPLGSPDAAAARADPTTQQAFICNLQVRRVAPGRGAQPQLGRHMCFVPVSEETRAAALWRSSPSRLPTPPLSRDDLIL